MPRPNDPQLIAKALAKAQSVEARLNALVVAPFGPTITYGSSMTVVTQSANGSYAWTCPAGVTQALIECWGAGGGGNGGSPTVGGAGGGGGAYSAEPAYPVTPGAVYAYQVGDGGTGGTVGTGGVNGTATSFDSGGAAGGVTAAGGVSYNAPSTGGSGGAASANTVSFAGGSGGGDASQSTGGCGGGGSAGSGGAGGSGTDSVSGTGTAGGPAGAGSGAAGGHGGNSAANGSAGISPGSGGGGSGAATAVSQVSLSYNPTGSGSYFGADATGGNANQRRNATPSDGTMYQGGETASGGAYNGTQKSVMNLPSSIAADLSGVTIDSCTLKIFNIHSWYNSGMTVKLGFGVYPGLGPAYAGGGLTNCTSFTVAEGAFHTQDLTSTNLPAALKAGTATGLVFGLAPAFDLNYYGYFNGAGSGGGKAPLLSITGHTGAAPVQAGAGADGQVQISYSLPSSVQAAMQPVAATDDAGNQVAQGLTGGITAISPVDPTKIETWHVVGTGGQPSFGAGFTFAATGQQVRFRLEPQGLGTVVRLDGVAKTTGATASPATIFTLPAGYVPNGSHFFAGICNFSGFTAVGQTMLEVNSDGTVKAFPSASGAGQVMYLTGITFTLDGT